MFHRQGHITTRLIPDLCYDSKESYSSASPETTWNGIIALDAHKAAVEQMSKPKYSRAQDTSEFLMSY